MAVTLDATVGAATANSYVTVDGAAAFTEWMLPAPDAFDAAAEATQIKLLVAATRYLDQAFDPVGDAVAPTVQALKWPRYGAPLVNAAGASDPRVLALLVESFEPTDAIPERVQRATVLLACELARQLAVTPDANPMASAQRAGVSSITIGGEISLTFEAGEAAITALERYVAGPVRWALGNLVYSPQPRVVRA